MDTTPIVDITPIVNALNSIVGTLVQILPVFLLIGVIFSFIPMIFRMFERFAPAFSVGLE